MIGGLAKADYKGIVHEKMINDCPADINDLKNAHKIFGPNLADLRGRTVWCKPELVEVKIMVIP